MTYQVHLSKPVAWIELKARVQNNVSLKHAFAEALMYAAQNGLQDRPVKGLVAVAWANDVPAKARHPAIWALAIAEYYIDDKSWVQWSVDEQLRYLTLYQDHIDDESKDFFDALATLTAGEHSFFHSDVPEDDIGDEEM